MGNSNKLLQGKVALVTGAGDGMGRHHAVMLASRGAAVIALDLDREAVAKLRERLAASVLRLQQM